MKEQKNKTKFFWFAFLFGKFEKKEEDLFKLKYVRFLDVEKKR